MKKTSSFLAFMALILVLTVTSCVSGKKFKASQARVDKLERDSTFTHSQLTDCNTNVKDLTTERSNLLNKNASLSDENASVSSDLKSLSSQSKLTIADQAKRLKNLQDIIQSQQDVMLKLKNTISAALINYKADELSVYIKDGNVYVSLQEKLLFKSGSDVVDPKGKEALKSLVQVLGSAPDITVIIEGHTDNVPIKTKLFKDNWDLSTSRASSILRIMTTDFGFDANRITASGKGEFHPILSNETTEGRAGNRRTEIILSPDLKELYKQLYK
ncbi:MAG TPA: OmpA family protein [Prolixibacteraceae bacterium]|jgi:chemotaxis protein MotB